MRVTQVSESTFTVKGHGVHTAFTEMTAALKHEPDIIVSVNKHGAADITHIHTIGIFSLSFLLFGRGKKIVSAHIVPESLRGSLVGANLWLPLATIYLRWFYNHADLVFAVSDATKRELIDMGVRSKIEVVYNLVDIERYKTTASDHVAARKSLNISEDDWVVIGAGQVQPRKRIDSFVEAALELPDMRFIWVGGMPFGRLAAENKHMKRLVQNAPSNVTFTGVIDHIMVKKYYQAGNAFWLPSAQETFGLVIVEAAAAGLPVMLRCIDDYKETFAGCALLEDEATFVPTLKRLKDDKTFYDHAVKRSHLIAEKFSLKKGVEQVLAAYRSIL